MLDDRQYVFFEPAVGRTEATHAPSPRITNALWAQTWGYGFTIEYP